jgi:hypothetical protein
MPTLLPNTRQTHPQQKRHAELGILLALVLLIALVVVVFRGTKFPNRSGASDNGLSASNKAGNSLSSGSEYFSVGNTLYSKFDVLYACRTDKDADNLGDMLKRQDHAAITRILLGPCKNMSRPGRLYVEKTKMFSDNLCVQPQGQIDCLWTNKGWLTKRQPGASAD